MKRFMELNPAEVKLAVEQYLNRKLSSPHQVTVPWMGYQQSLRFEVEDVPLTVTDDTTGRGARVFK